MCHDVGSDDPSGDQQFRHSHSHNHCSIRILGNVIIIVASMILRATPRSRRTQVPIAADGLSLVLNLIYCATESTAGPWAGYS